MRNSRITMIAIPQFPFRRRLVFNMFLRLWIEKRN